MDISSEARVGPFSIGPSRAVSRVVALHILLCSSFSRLQHRLLQSVQNSLARLRRLTTLLPLSLLLLAALLTSLLLRRRRELRAWVASARRRRLWQNKMRTAVTYEGWAHAAKMVGEEAAGTEEKVVEEAELYDEGLVKGKLAELRRRRQRGSMRDMVFCMRGYLLRNLGNMCNPQLHKGRVEVPELIREYIDEVSTQLRMVCEPADPDELPLEEALASMHETRHAFGRTALLLSGGATLGSFHVGVVQALVEHHLLPRIIAGSSVGSIVCSIVATRSRPELERFFEDPWPSLQFFEQMGGVLAVVRRVAMQGALHEIRSMQRRLRALTGNLTFQEAYDRTGRILGITVCSPRRHEPPRCLSYLTAPNVVIWSAVTASCAFPGLFEAQELMAKDGRGELVPFHSPFLDLQEEERGGGAASGGAGARRWRDGSLEVDLPMMQLKELFNVNHFIVSQANPHIAPLLRVKEFVRAHGGNFAAKLAKLAEMEVKHRCHQILELGFPLGGVAKLFAQDWEGDVTIVMPATLDQYLKIIKNISHVDLQRAINQGRRGTWEKLSAIKANCAIELGLDECVALLNHKRLLRRSSERAAASHGANSSDAMFHAPRRIPSWNHIARENSWGSIDEEALADTAIALCDGIEGGGGGGRDGGGLTSNSWIHLTHSVQNGSDGEPHCIDNTPGPSHAS